MRVTRANFGEYKSIYPAKPDTAAFWFDNRRWFIEDGAREAGYDDYSYAASKGDHGPFGRADFGSTDRFTWTAGACAIGHSVDPSYWSERFAVWVERTTLVVIDATRPLIVRLELGVFDLNQYATLMIHGGKLWLPGSTAIVWFALADIEALFDRAAGPVPLEITELYPRRRPDRTVTARVDVIGETEVRAHVRAGARNVKFPLVPGLGVRMEVTLRDEMIADVYREITLPGQSPRALRDPFPEASTATVKLAVETAIDPAGELVRPAEATGMRQGDLDRLFAARVDDPDDDATRFVIVDLLEAGGEAYAPKLQALLADGGTPETCQAALGTLASYLTAVEYRGGLPWAGTLSEKAPLDQDIGDIVLADQRLGLFHTLRIGDGNFNLYAKVVASPRGVGLRHVDVPRASIVAALIAAQRRGLTRLSSVKFATREMNEGLADSTFDRVYEIETETAMAVVDKFLDFIVRDEMKFFSRAPRHLLLRDKMKRDEQLMLPVIKAWDSLPLDKVTIAGVTLGRDGVAHATESASPFAVSIAQTKLRLA